MGLILQFSSCVCVWCVLLFVLQSFHTDIGTHLFELQEKKSFTIKMCNVYYWCVLLTVTKILLVNEYSIVGNVVYNG